jgi:ribonuclease HI
VYLDDWLILAESREILQIHTQKVLAKAVELGWKVNREKSNLVPSRQFTFLGMDCDTQSNLVKPCQKRITGIAQAVQDLLTHQFTSPRLLMSLIGKMISVGDLLPFAKLERRPLQFLLREYWDGDQESLDGKMPVTRAMRDAVLWWASPKNLLGAVRIRDLRESVTLITDASSVGWGAHLGDHLISGIWSQEEKKAYSNILEMWAVRNALRAFKELLCNKRVQLLTDNTTVASYITRQGGLKSSTLYLEVREILLWCKHQNITLMARHIPGKRNVLADKLSRPGRAISTEWMLDPQVFKQITRQTWIPLTDLFATRWNNQTPQFISPFPDQKALAVDALNLDWNSLERPYLFPPTALIQVCLERIQESTNMFLAVIPCWQNRPWFPLLLSLLIDYPVQLPAWGNLLSQGLGWRDRKFHENPAPLILTVWALSGDLSLREGFLRRLRRERPNPNGNPHLGSMTGFGRDSLVGWSQEGHQIHSRPLLSC